MRGSRNIAVTRTNRLTLLAALIGLFGGYLIGKRDSPTAPVRDSQSDSAQPGLAPAESRVWLARWIEREKSGQASTIKIAPARKWGGDEEDRKLLRLAHADFEAAVRKLEGDHEDPDKQARAIYDLLFKPLCATDLSAAVEFAASHPFHKINPSEYFFQYVPVDQLGALARALDALPESEFRTLQLRSTLQWWQTAYPEAAGMWAQENLRPDLPGEADLLLHLSINSKQAPENISELLKHCSQESSNRWFGYRARHLIGHPSTEISDRAEEMLAMAGPQQRRAIANGLGLAWVQVAPQDAMEWMLALEDPELRQSALSISASNWFSYLPQRAYQWLASLPAQQAEEVRKAAATRGYKIR